MLRTARDPAAVSRRELSHDRRARAFGPSKGRVPWRVALSGHRVGCSRIFGRGPTSFPSSASEEHPLSSVRAPAEEETSANGTDRPRSAFLRRPAKGAAIPRTRCFPPPRRQQARDCSRKSVLRRPLAHAAHTFSPVWGKVLVRALQALVARVAPCASFRESERLSYQRVLLAAPGADVPSAPDWLGRRVRAGG